MKFQNLSIISPLHLRKAPIFFLKFEQLNLYRMMNLLTPVAEPPCSYWVHMNPIKLAYSLYKHYIFNGYMYFKSSL
jgi:hypothetical protein